MRSTVHGGGRLCFQQLKQLGLDSTGGAVYARLLPYIGGKVSLDFNGQQITLFAPGNTCQRLKNDLVGGEAEMLAKVADVIEKDDVFWDVGAHIGVYSLVVGAAADPKHIVAFEPTPFFHHICSRNFQLNNTMVNTRDEFLDGPDSDGRRRVPGDEIIGNVPPPTVVKMDIEGGEKAAIPGMENQLRTSIRELFLELHPSKLPETDVDDLIDHIQSQGFESNTLGYRGDQRFIQFTKICSVE